MKHYPKYQFHSPVFLWLCLFVVMGFLSSCNVTKHLGRGEVLYEGAEVIVQPDSSDLSVAKRITPLLEEITRPKPNSRLFGFPYKVAAYYLLGEPTQERGLKRWFREKFGERPVLIAPTMVERNTTLLKDYLETEGFFRSQVAGELATKNQRGKAIYRVKVAPRYYLNEVSHVADTLSDIHPELSEDFLSKQNGTLLASDQPYRFENIKAERSRIDRELRNSGYYFFRPDFVSIEADSTVGGRTVDLAFSLDYNIPQRAQKKYVINDIFVYSSKDLRVFDNASAPTNQTDLFRGLILADSAKTHNQRIFTDAIGFRPGNYFSTEQNNVSLQRLINLNNFQFVQNKFEVVNRLDSSLLNVSYYLTPMKRQSLRAELNAISRSSGFGGTQVKVNWMNRNLFRGAEQLTLSVSGASEIQFGGEVNTLDNNNRGNYRLGVSSTLTFPRFVSPIFKVDPEISRILPKTIVTVGYESILKTGFYNLNSANALWSYVWRKGNEHEFTLNPFSLNIVKTTNISTAFIEQFFQNPTLLRLLDNQLILGSSLSYNFTPVNLKSSKNIFLFSGNFDAAGTLVGLYHSLKKTPNNKRSLFKEFYAQYARIDGDFRYYRDFSPTLRLANRAFVGVGIPYGNSITLPYPRQYFSGGTNSIRAFRARGIGPGNYKRQNSVSEQFLGLFTGDVKLELNSEVRYKFTDFIGMAAFVDAGNVWLYRDTNIYNEKGVINKNFLKEIAVGTGVGLRLDFSFFVFRVDVATPIRIPSEPEGERWVFKKIDLKKPEWRVINIAVGYPF